MVATLAVCAFRSASRWASEVLVVAIWTLMPSDFWSRNEADICSC